MAAPKIVQLACCAVPGERRTFVNVYGLDDQGRVWQWQATEAKWSPYKITKRATSSDAPEGF
jgi:hypothetical protein